MRSQRLAVVVALALAAGCGGGPEDGGGPPEVPVQGGEALQVEADPAATDSATRGTPGAAVQPADTL